MSQSVPLKQLTEFSWEIPRTFKEGMLVPAKIYATKKLLDGMDRGVFEQVTNVACLPGIVGNSFAMADAHWGYGFPIGGVAAFDLEEGVISPGGIGFDINCLHPDSRVYDENGVWRRIEDADISSTGFTTYLASARSTGRTRAVLKQKRTESGLLLKIKTSWGKVILATSDHPIQTRRGMIPAGEITFDDSLLTSGVEGVAFSKPGEVEAVSEDSLIAAMKRMGITDAGNARSQVLAQLRRHSLNRVALNSQMMPELLKILGFVFGGGTIPRSKRGAHASFYGRAEDLDSVKADLAALGFRSHTFTRQRHHRIRTAYGVQEFGFRETSLQAPSTALAVLLVALGAPYGEKAACAYRLPGWLSSAEDWQKKLFLGAYFGAELSRPRSVNGYDFQMPLIGVNKLEHLAPNAIEFLEDLRALLKSLGVASSAPVRVKGYDYNGKRGRSVGFRFGILSNTGNLRRLFGGVGYAYNKGKQRLASIASSYLAYLQTVREGRDTVRRKAIEMYSSGVPTREVVETLSSSVTGRSFIQHSIWGGREASRAWNPIRFEAFIEQFEEPGTGLVFDQVLSIEPVPYEGPVYDVTIDDPNHNFIAEGVVVSNCGMRLLRTNLRFSEVRPRVKELIDTIFKLVPAGVGVKGFLRVSDSKFEEIMQYGVKWCAENDLAWKDDPAHVEEGGFIKGADPSKVSRQARSRGIEQLGTLGSGNHYLEIQVVDPARYFDRELSKHFGIVQEDQVVVMVHCGSRGFGHQIGTDYLRVFDGAMKRYGVSVRDRELACAPASSKEGRDYYGAMVCAANMAFTNRQVIIQRVREAFGQVFHRDPEALDMHLVYDVCHNIAKVERHKVDGSSKELLVHRKGATRSFGPGHPDVPAAYRDVGQPVIIGGSMETGSYLLLGTQMAMEQTFGSTAHGSGRTMSRTAAKRTVRGAELQKKMLDRGIYVKSATMDGLAEEAGLAYKDISEVVETMALAGISKKVAALRPIGNVKG